MTKEQLRYLEYGLSMVQEGLSAAYRMNMQAKANDARINQILDMDFAEFTVHAKEIPQLVKENEELDRKISCIIEAAENTHAFAQKKKKNKE